MEEKAVRLCHVVSIREDNGQKVYMTAYPDTRKHCCTIMSKITVHKHRRIQLEEYHA